jgi:hypothetical protein
VSGDNRRRSRRIGRRAALGSVAALLGVSLISAQAFSQPADPNGPDKSAESVEVSATSEQQSVLQALDGPVEVPISSAPEQAPAVQKGSAVARPGSVNDAQYAAEKAAAETAVAPLDATQVPVPPPAASAAQAPVIATTCIGLNRQTAINNGSVFVPPDTTLGKSPNRAIEATNSAIRLFTNTCGVVATANLNTFFGAAVANGLLFDPKVYYDRNATRPRVYVVGLQAAGKGNTSLADNVSRMWVAVSRSADPTNLTTNWCRYNVDARSAIGTTSESWGDYPGIGAGRDSLSVTLNNFTFTNSAFQFARIHVFNKTTMSNNAASCPTVPRFVFQPSTTAGNFGLFTIQPAQHYTSPSSATGTTNPAYYLSTTRGTSSSYHVHRIRNVASGSPTYSRVTLTNRSYGIPPSGSQSGTTTRIDSGDNRVMQVAGVGNTLVGQFATTCNFTSGTTNESCSLAPRVTVAIGAGGALSASIPENTFQGFGDNIYVHHPSTATDTALRSGSTWEFNGNTFRLSSAAMIKNVNAAWSGIQTYAAGTCSFTGATARSGDYSGAQLDPSLTGFWLAGEQTALIGGSCQWQTRIVRLNP